MYNSETKYGYTINFRQVDYFFETSAKIVTNNLAIKVLKELKVKTTEQNIKLCKKSLHKACFMYVVLPTGNIGCKIQSTYFGIYDILQNNTIKFISLLEGEQLNG